jgi:hypothetical protein
VAATWDVGAPPRPDRMAMKAMAITTTLDRIMVRTEAAGFRHGESMTR